MNITAGKYKGTKIAAPNEKITRPTLSKTRMGIFNSLYSLIGNFNGKTFLDVFGGSGIMGLEALSRGFERVKTYEIDKKSAEIIKTNYKKLRLTPDLIIGDCRKFLEKTEEVFDVVFIDPPYECGFYEEILASVRGTIIVVESSVDIDFSGFEIINQKKYGNSFITYLKRNL